MNLYCESLFNGSVTKGVHSVLLFLLISLYFLRVESTSTNSSLEEYKKNYHDISSIDDYANFMKLLNGVKLEESFHLTFLCFKNGTELLRFLGWSYKSLDGKGQCEESSNDQNPNDCKLSLQDLLVNICAQLSATSSDLSDEFSSLIKRAFMNLTRFHFYSDGISNELICEIVQSLPRENFAQFMKAIYQKFSSESQAYVLKMIDALFPSSKLASYSKDFSPKLIDYMFSEYQKSMNCSSDNEIEIELLKSMLISLFYEKLSNEFIKALPTNLKYFYVRFSTKFPILIDFSQSLKHFPKVDISLHGNYFDYSSYDLTQLLSTSDISLLRLNNPNLTYHFLIFLEDNSEKYNIIPNAECSEISNSASFKNVKFLTIHLSIHTFYTKLEHLKNLSSLRFLSLEGSLNYILFALCKLKKVVNLTKIKIIRLCIITSPLYDIFCIERNSETGEFEEKDFDIESKIEQKINEYQTKISCLNSREVENSDSELRAIDKSTSQKDISLNSELKECQKLLVQISQFKITVLKCTSNAFDSISQEYYESDNVDFDVKSFITEVDQEFRLHVNSNELYEILAKVIVVFSEIRSKIISEDDENEYEKLEILNQIIEEVDAKSLKLNETDSLDCKPLEI